MTTSSSHLSSDKVNLLELKEWLRREFLSFFEDCSGKKVYYLGKLFRNGLINFFINLNCFKSIIWDNQLTQPLGLIADYKVLKANSKNIFLLNKQPINNLKKFTRSVVLKK